MHNFHAALRAVSLSDTRHGDRILRRRELGELVSVQLMDEDSDRIESAGVTARSRTDLTQMY
jgi:hypothetical protein